MRNSYNFIVEYEYTLQSKPLNKNIQIKDHLVLKDRYNKKELMILFRKKLIYIKRQLLKESISLHYVDESMKVISGFIQNKWDYIVDHMNEDRQHIQTRCELDFSFKNGDVFNFNGFFNLSISAIDIQ